MAALYSMFIFILSVYLSHEISDKHLSFSENLLRGFEARKATKQRTWSREDAEVPRFLLDLYRQRTHLVPRGRLNKRVPDIVRVFLREPSGQDEHRSGPLHHRFFFNLSAITNKEKVKKAELRIFKKKPHTQSTEGNFMIRLFRLDISYNKSSQLQKNNGVFVASRLVSNKEKVGRWISLDITSVVKLWTEAKTRQNFGIRLSVQGFNEFSKDFRIGNRGRRAPFLVTYTEDPQLGIELTKSLINCTNSQVIERNDYSPNNTSTVARNRAKRSSLQRCRKRWAYVSFKKLKWDWIVAPKGYSANYCEGICTTNLDITLNPTNHAILQSILHRMDSRIPSPSCVPTKLHSISVLYRTSDRSVALTEYGGMIVSSCGCH